VTPSSTGNLPVNADAPRGGGRLRIATLLSFPPGPGSGLGAFVSGLMEALQRNTGLELQLIAPSRVRGAAGQRVSQLLLALEQMVKLYRLRPDVVHAHDHPVLLAAAIGYRELSRAPVQVIFSSHLDPVQRLALWKRLLVGWLFSRCRAVTVVAQDSVEKLGCLATPVPQRDRVRVVPGAATVRIRDRRDPEVLAYGASIGYVGGPVLLQVANFIYPAKVEGAVRLMEALVDVRRRFPDVHLILLGTGPLLGRVEDARTRLGLMQSVTIPGTFVEDLSLPAGLSDIHCHITLQDGCPISILEAMHAGKPVVASRVGGIPEMIEDGVDGVLVGNDPGEIAAAIVELLEHTDAASRMGARARRTAHSRFTWERVAADFERVYRGVPAAERLDRKWRIS
jgi:glycosyltransferase involved in cell wall biosynthesis